MTQQSNTIPQLTPHLQTLRSYLSHRARITSSDGRQFIGSLVCTDRDRNVVLAHAEEFRDGEQRLVGLVMIPGRHLVRIEIENFDTEAEDSIGLYS